MERKLDLRSAKRRVAWLGACLLVLGSAPGGAAVFEVDSSLDLPDANPGDGVCEVSAGLGTCTLRAAIEEANGTPNAAGAPDRIEFDIDPPGIHTIEVSGNGYPDISETVVIDGWTQPGSVFNTVPDAFNGVVAIEIENLTAQGVTGLSVIASNVEIKGVAVRGFRTGVFFGQGFAGEGGRLEGCRIEDNESAGVATEFDRTVIGGGTPRSANVISGNGAGAVAIGAGVSAVLVRGNVIGTDPAGQIPNGNGTFGAAIQDAGTGTNIVGNLIAAQSSGAAIDASGSDGVIQDNRIGTNRTGTSTAGFGNGEGINLQGDGWLIGGVQSHQGNLIGGSLWEAIQVDGTQNRIEGNFIGATRQANADIGNGELGITVYNSDNSIGGFFPDRANVIHHNALGGIAVFFPAERVEIGNNSMLLNGDASLPGIDLVPVARGVTPNDPGDPDEGTNRLQNFPIIDAATREVGTTHIEGDFDSLPGQFELQFFSSRTCHPTGHGEGEQLLGRRTLTLPGDESFAFDFPVGAIGPVFTALATDADGNTSEWSPCLSVAGDATADLDVRKRAVGGDFQRPDQPFDFMITVANSGPLSAINTVAVDTLPPGLDFVSANPAPSSVVGGTVTWNLGTLDLNDVATLTLTVEVDDTFLTPDFPCAGYGNEFTNTVRAGSDQLDLNPDNDEALKTVQVLTGNDLSISLTPAGQGAAPSTPAPLSVTVRNDGPENASGVSASGTAPGVDCGSAIPAFTSCDAATGEWTWGAGDLLDGEAASLDFSMQAPSVLGETVVTEAALVPTGDPTCDDIMASAQVAAGDSADLAILSITQFGGSNMAEGSWDVVVRNNGPDPAESTRYVYSAKPGGFDPQGVQPRNCGAVDDCVLDEPGLSVGEVRRLSFDVNDVTNLFEFRVTARADTGMGGGQYEVFDPAPSNNEAFATGRIHGLGCGMGNVELVLLLPPILWLGHRRRRRR